MKLVEIIVCIVTIGCIGFVRGSNESVARLRPHEGKPTDCRNTRMELNDSMREVKCMPRKSLVKLRAEPGYIFFPNIVSVNRCDGLCGNDLSCLSVVSSIKPILVRRQHITSRELFCYRVYVEEHTKCKCKCSVMPDDCNENQVYIQEECACKCMNFEEQEICNSLSGMIWNPEKCKCTCATPEEECSTGLVWIPSLCRCGKVMAVMYDRNQII